MPKNHPSKPVKQKPASDTRAQTLIQAYQVMDSLSSSIFAGLATTDGKVIYANRSALEAIGMKLEDVVGKPVEATAWMARSDNNREQIRAALRSAAKGMPVRLEFAFEAVDGHLKIMDLTVQPVRGEDRAIHYIVTTAQDITERKRIAQLLTSTHAAMNHARIALLQIRADGCIHYANEAACKLLGYSREALREMPVFQLSPRVARDGWSATWDKFQTRKSMRYESTYLRTDGQEVPVEVTASYLAFENDEYAIAFINDLSESKQAEQQLHFLANFDSLTGLPNRTCFLGIIGQYLRHAEHEQSLAAVVIVDIERFWLINDALGRTLADQMLRLVAERFCRYADGQNRLARLGADQFGVVISGIKSKEEVVSRIERKLRDVFGQPFVVGDNEIRVTVKLGVSMFPENGADAEGLLRFAEMGLIEAKESMEKYLFYHPRMAERDVGRLKLENKLRHAMERNEFVLHYQPKVSVDGQHIEGVEALLRWHDPEVGLIPPMRFIPLLEETGMIHEVGAWALRQAARDFRSWKGQGLVAPRIAVNVSAAQLRKQDFVQTVEREITVENMAAGIDLEITESLVMQDIGSTIVKLKAVREMGVEISIDDFGTGYSSLAYLTKLPVQILKIDRSFVSAMLHEADTKTLVSGIISLAHALRMKVVAEGVETREQADVLRLLGCDQLQGFLFCKPVSAEEFVMLLANGSLLNLEIKVDSIAFHQHLNESIKFARRGLVGERVPATREPMYRD